MTTKQKATKIIEILEALYPNPQCGLDWKGDPYKLLIMAILSAQCKDERVNLVSKTLFEKYPTPDLMAKAELQEIEAEIHSIGLFRGKAKALKESSLRLTEVYGGKVPSDMKELLTLRGVGRKVANLLRGDIYNLGGIVADTHCIRISGRLGLSNGKDPLKTEKDLSKIIPLEKQSDFCHRIVLFGREICSAKSPKCDNCPLKDCCNYDR